MTTQRRQNENALCLSVMTVRKGQKHNFIPQFIYSFLCPIIMLTRQSGYFSDYSIFRLLKSYELYVMYNSCYRKLSYFDTMIKIMFQFFHFVLE